MNATNAEDDRHQRPGRWRWWVWLLIAVPSTLIIAVSAYLAFAYYLDGALGGRIFRSAIADADRALDEQIERHRAAGEPVLAQDFHTNSIPDDDNAAYFLKAAAMKIESIILPGHDEPKSRQRAWLDPNVSIPFQGPNSQAWHEALVLVRQSRKASRVDWGIQLTSPIINQPVDRPYLEGVRMLARAISRAAGEYAKQGDWVEVVEAWYDMLLLGPRLDSAGYSTVDHLIRVACDSLLTASIEEHIAELALSGVTAGNEVQQQTLRARVQALILALLNEESLHSGWRRGMFGERMMMLDTVLAMTSGKTILMAGQALNTGSMMSGATSLLWKHDVLSVFDRTERRIAAARADLWCQAEELLPPPVREQGGVLGTLTELPTQLLEPPLERALLLHFRIRAERRMAAVALAVRMYQIDHGELPATLEALVPAYLATVPLDPLGDGPIRYRRDTSVPLLYSLNRLAAQNGCVVAIRKHRIVSDGSNLLFLLAGEGARDRLCAMNGDDVNRLFMPQVREPAQDAGAADVEWVPYSLPACWSTERARPD